MASNPQVEEWRRNREDFILDVRLLLSSGSPERMAERMGMDLVKIRGKLRRLGRHDLADLILAEEERYHGVILKGFCASA